MAAFYKVDVRSEYHDLSNQNTKVIMSKGLIFAKEIITKHKLVICDNKYQGAFYDYYVMSTDFTIENIASLKDVEKYINDFTFDVFPVHTKMEDRETKKLLRKRN
jgi:hypothetical protein